MTKQCRNCKWYIKFAGVCANGASEHCADFMDDNNTCEEWEEEE